MSKNPLGPAKVHIRNNATGEVRVFEDDYWSDDYQWEDGNYSCDCNRHNFFEQAAGNTADLDGDCGFSAFHVVKVELPGGGEHPTPAIFNFDS